MNRLASGTNHHRFHGADHRLRWALALLALLLLTLLFLSAAARTAAARPVTIWVATWGDDKEGDGSREFPFRTITRALDAAESGTTVHVIEGTYEENVKLKAGVILEGEGAGVTTIQGDGTDSVVIADSIGSDAKIDGFTITGGGGSQVLGGGIYCRDCSPTVSNNRITGNAVSPPNEGGAGICCQGGSPAILNNEISNNTGTGLTPPPGGGIYCVQSASLISGNLIVGNSAVHGGGILCDTFGGTIVNNLITGNTAAWRGAGIEVLGGAPTVANNTVAFNNEGWDGGGGIHVESGTPSIYNCII